MVNIEQFTVCCRFAFVVVDADVTVVGSGPGGYVAAIKAAQLGFKVRVRLKLGFYSLLFGESWSYSQNIWQVDNVSNFLILYILFNPEANEEGVH